MSEVKKITDSKQPTLPIEIDDALLEEQTPKRKYLPGLNDDQVFDMFEEWCLGYSVRYLEKKYDASYRIMRRVCRQKLISVCRHDTELMKRIIDRAKEDREFKYTWNHL